MYAWNSLHDEVRCEADVWVIGIVVRCRDFCGLTIFLRIWRSQSSYIALSCLRNFNEVGAKAVLKCNISIWEQWACNIRAYPTACLLVVWFVYGIYSFTSKKK